LDATRLGMGLEIAGMLWRYGRGWTMRQGASQHTIRHHDHRTNEARRDVVGRVLKCRATVWNYHDDGDGRGASRIVYSDSSSSADSPRNTK